MQLETLLNLAPRIVEPDRLLQATPRFVRMHANNLLPIKPARLFQNLQMINSSQPKRSIFTPPSDVEHPVRHPHRFQQPDYLLRVPGAFGFPASGEIKRHGVHVLCWLENSIRQGQPPGLKASSSSHRHNAPEDRARLWGVFLPKRSILRQPSGLKHRSGPPAISSRSAICRLCPAFLGFRHHVRSSRLEFMVWPGRKNRAGYNAPPAEAKGPAVRWPG